MLDLTGTVDEWAEKSTWTLLSFHVGFLTPISHPILRFFVHCSRLTVPDPLHPLVNCRHFLTGSRARLVDCP